MTVDVVPAGIAHAALLAALHAAAFGESWSAGTLAELLAHPRAFALMATQGAPTAAEPLGFILCRTAAEECEILTLAVRPAARRQGIGTTLLRAAMTRAAAAGARVVFLEVAEDNDPAQALYRRAGFAPVGRRRGYYRPAGGGTAGDALVLRRTIPVESAQ
jgi:ribosomal-protein-alanine N-acetyltransferase